MAKCNAIYRFLLSITAIILILWTILAGDLLNRLSFRKSPSPGKRVQILGSIDRLT
jgi:hypothetical protein